MSIDIIKNRAGEDRKIERREHAPHRVSTSWTEGKDYISIAVHFGLHFIRGNHAPYFSITIGEGRINGGRDSFGGANHETIVRELPELADVAALHLSDIDGVPLHAEANGWYQLAGACGGFNERYHGGQERYGKPADPLGVFADHCRISRERAAEIAAEVVAYDVAVRNGVAWKDRVSGVAGRERWKQLVEEFKPRWKAEAEAAIEKYALNVYGDPWKPAKEVA